MLITSNEIRNILIEHNIIINGAFHIGAHECEELDIYDTLGINRSNIIWIDGNKKKVEEARARGIENVYYSVITNVDRELVEFNITNNGQSSSVLDFGTHLHNYPHIHFVEKQQHNSITIDTFAKQNNINMAQYDFWNFDIQGAELMALKGSINSIKHAKVIYLEVNIEEVYKGGALISEIDDFLSKYGFKRVITKLTTYGWGDAMYILSN